MYTFIAILFAALLIFMLSRTKQELPETKLENERIKVGTYIGGHPKIDTEASRAALEITSEGIIIFGNRMHSGIFKVMRCGKIPLGSITGVSCEDHSTLNKRITLGRVLLVGIFALAWKKKEKKEKHYLIIEWREKKFSHETIFMIEGKNSANNCNIARNYIINKIE